MNQYERRMKAKMKKAWDEMIRLGLVEQQADGKCRLAKVPGIMELGPDGKLHEHPNAEANIERLQALTEQASGKVQ